MHCIALNSIARLMNNSGYQDIMIIDLFIWNRRMNSRNAGYGIMIS
jgi:hypothetical protein